MSVDTSRTTALFRAGHRPATCCSTQCVSSIAFQMARSAETQRQRRSFKPGDPIRYSQSQYPGALTASAARRTAIKSP